MTNIGSQVLNLIRDTSKSAPDITHALKVLGNGSMQKGLARIGIFFSNEINAVAAKELTRGRCQGVIVGTLGTAALGGLITLIVNMRNIEATHEVEGQKILTTIKQSIPTSESSVNVMDSADIDLLKVKSENSNFTKQHS